MKNLYDMKRMMLLAIMSIGTCLPFMAQDMDAEMQKLIRTVSMLRQADKSKYEQVSQTLISDEKWTPMDELIDASSGECRPTDKTLQWFKLNRILQSAPAQSQNRNNVSAGNFLNGEDTRYNYSLIEKSVKAGKSVTYSMKGREGIQHFVIIPYDAKVSKSIVVEVYRGMNEKDCLLKGGLKRTADGSIYFDVSATPKLKVTDTITLRIRNRGNANMALVIINHNTRK